jgi:glycerate kinase
MKQRKRVIAFCGSQAIDAVELAPYGIDAIFPIVKYPMEWQVAKEHAYQFLKDTAFSVGNLLKA